MKMRHIVSLAAALGLALVPAPLCAQTAGPPTTAANPTVGATIYDAQGAEVGRIESVTGGNAVVFTGTNRATIPLSSFGIGPKGPTLGMTRAQLDDAASKAAAAATEQLRARLTPGTEVRGKAGAVIATVKALEGDSVVLSTGKSEVRVPITGVGVNAQGIFIGMTQAEFDAAVAAGAGTGQ
jgi:hypothetical protein